jgi:hypothetical protein
VLCLALTSWKRTPDELLGKNPFAQGTPAHQNWAEMNLRAKEQLALFHADLLESMPPEDASAKQFLDCSLMVVGGIFDIFARALSSDAMLSDQAAEIYEEYLIEIGKAIEADAHKSRILSISERLFSTEVRRRLHQRKQYWTGHILRTVRERKEASSAKALLKRGDVPEPSAGSVDEPKNNGECTEDSTPEREAALPESPQATNANGEIAASAGRRRGPRPNYEMGLRVAEIVARVAGKYNWRRKLDDICIELDEEAIPRPKTWKARGHHSWFDSLRERHLAEKAITHHLEMAERGER